MLIGDVTLGWWPRFVNRKRRQMSISDVTSGWRLIFLNRKWRQMLIDDVTSGRCPRFFNRKWHWTLICDLISRVRSMFSNRKWRTILFCDVTFRWFAQLETGSGVTIFFCDVFPCNFEIFPNRKWRWTRNSNVTSDISLIFSNRKWRHFFSVMSVSVEVWNFFEPEVTLNSCQWRHFRYKIDVFKPEVTCKSFLGRHFWLKIQICKPEVMIAGKMFRKTAKDRAAVPAWWGNIGVQWRLRIDMVKPDKHTLDLFLTNSQSRAARVSAALGIPNGTLQSPLITHPPAKRCGCDCTAWLFDDRR